MLNLTAGLSTPLALKVEAKTKDQEMAALSSSAIHKRAIEAFHESAPAVESIDDFINDYDTFSFVMKAFDMEEKIYAKGLIKKALESDLDDKNSLINRLDDPNLKAMAEAMGFIGEGTTNLNTFSSQWRGEIVDRYMDTKYINGQRENNETLGVILKVRDKIEEGAIKNWYNVMGDVDLGDFFRTALGISDETIRIDIDKQADMFAEKFDLEKLSDPEEVEKLINRYAILKDLETGTTAVTSSIVQLVNPTATGISLNYDFESLASFSWSRAYG